MREFFCAFAVFKRAPGFQVYFVVQVRSYQEMDGDDYFQQIPDVRSWEDRGEVNPQKLLCEILRMSSFEEGNAAMSAALLNIYENTNLDAFAYSAADNCYYNYSIDCDGYGYAHIMAIYLREPTDVHGQFQDIEMQFMRLYFKEGGYAGSSLAVICGEQAWRTQTAALICAVEKLLSGESILNYEDTCKGLYEDYTLYQLPGNYTLGEYKVEVSSRKYECTLGQENFSYEGALLVNYRIHK